MDIQYPAIPGLVWAYRFEPGSQLCTRLAPTAQWSDMESSDGFFWLHLNLADTRVVAFLDSIPGFDENIRAILTTHETHPSITVDEGALYGTLVDFQREFDQETRDLGWLHFALTDRFVITTRLQPLRSVDRLRAAIDKNPKRFSTPSHIFEGLVAEFQRSLINLVMETTEELNAIEDYVYAAAPRDERRRLAPVRRTVVRLHRHLRTVLTLMRRASAADEDEMPAGFEEIAGRLTSRLESVDYDVYALQERARLLHEEIDSKLSSETNRHLYILSIMTAFLLPPTLVTGFFGMNTSALPFIDGGNGTLYAAGFIVASSLLAWFLLRRVGII